MLHFRVLFRCFFACDCFCLCFPTVCGVVFLNTKKTENICLKTDFGKSVLRILRQTNSEPSNPNSFAVKIVVGSY